MNIVIASDHRGYEQKEYIKSSLSIPGQTINWMDVGTHDSERTDYPLFAIRACTTMREKNVGLAILLCGSGNGIAIAANRFKKIYAAVVWNEDVARQSRTDDYANVLVIPADYVSKELALAMIQAWLQATPKPGRYADRIKIIDELGGK